MSKGSGGPGSGGRSVNTTQLITELMEERRKNQELTARLDDFERKRSFLSSGLNLPEGYFDDLVE